MSKREPPSVAIIAARIAKAYPSLAPYSAASLATELESIERAQRTHATRQCNGPREAKGDVPGYFRLAPSRSLASQDPRAPKGMEWVHDPDAEQRAGERIARRVAAWVHKVLDRVPEPDLAKSKPGAWCPAIELQGDPRGAVLLLRLPGEAEGSGV